MQARKLNLLEGARFSLALLVVIWHYYYYGPRANYFNLGASGFLTQHFSFAVHSFFTVSGFVILISAKGKSAQEFIKGRFLRLAPAILVCASITLMAYSISSSDPADEIIKKLRTFIKSISVFPIAYKRSGMDDSYWSLMYELRFYILIAIALPALNKRNGILAISVLLLANDIAQILISATHHGDYIMPFGAYGAFFCAGALMYTGITNLRSKFLAALTFAVCIADIHTESARISQLTHSTSANLFESTAISAICLLVVHCSLRNIDGKTPTQLLKILGGASYPLYLVHQGAGFAIIKPLADQGIDARPATILAAVLISILISEYIEPRVKEAYRICIDALAVRLKPLMA